MADEPIKGLIAGARPGMRQALGAYIHVKSGVERNLGFLGGLILFTARAVTATPLVVRKYAGEVRRQISDLTLGTGFLITFTGTLGVILIESIFVGIEVGVQGFQGLKLIGIAPLSGFIAAYGNTREIAPLIAAVAIAAQVGCKFTAQIGAQRISEEIDALEVMAIPSLPYLVTTRLLSAYIAVVPLYLVGLSGSYVATRLTIGTLYHQSLGTYDHYFGLFLHPIDVVYSVLKVLIFTTIIILLHSYYGYNTTGGPAGVGTATARAIRAVTVSIAASDIALTMLFWGLHSVRLSGG
ncbi:MAG: ABC transporter permease [Actinomycetota bacterium]|nr:ABC transporter permease [Actinomycetota bacterium]